MGGGFIEFLMTGSVPAHRQGAPVMQRQPMPAPLSRSVTRGYEIEPSHPVQASRQVAALPDESQLLERREESRIRAAVDPQYQRQEVTYTGPHGPGTIVIDTPNRFSTLCRAMAGRCAMELAWASWLRMGRGEGHHPQGRMAGLAPPAQMLKRRPDLPPFMAGGPGNPLGARALYLGSSLYRIHGTNEPETIGRAVSSGCIRMNNEDVIDLYGRVKVGTRVIVI